MPLPSIVLCRDNFLLYERNNSYYFFRANQQKAGTKIYSLTQCSLTVNICDWYILAGNGERINFHCLTRMSKVRLNVTFASVSMSTFASTFSIWNAMADPGFLRPGGANP